jgi:hypothetical protein
LQYSLQPLKFRQAGFDRFARIVATRRDGNGDVTSRYFAMMNRFISGAQGQPPRLPCGLKE